MSTSTFLTGRKIKMPCVLHQVDWTHRFTLVEHCTTAYSTAFVMDGTYLSSPGDKRSVQSGGCHSTRSDPAARKVAFTKRWRISFVVGFCSWWNVARASAGVIESFNVSYSVNIAHSCQHYISKGTSECTGQHLKRNFIVHWVAP